MSKGSGTLAFAREGGLSKRTDKPDQQSFSYTRHNTPQYYILLRKYTKQYQALREQANKNGQPYIKLDQAVQDADAWVIFDGPTAQTTKTMQRDGLHVLQSLDKLNTQCPWDITNKIDAVAMLLYCLVYRPFCTLLSPECTVWAKSQDFNNNKRWSCRASARRKTKRTWTPCERIPSGRFGVLLIKIYLSQLF